MRANRKAILAGSTALAGAAILAIVLAVPKNPDPAGPAKPPGRPDVRKLEGNHWIVPSAARQEYLRDPGRLNQDLNLLPTPGSQPDSIVGLRIAKIRPESPMFGAGFRKEDRILKVNDRPVTTLSRAINLSHEIEKSATLTVQIERDGRVVDYRFDFE